VPVVSQVKSSWEIDRYLKTSPARDIGVCDLPPVPRHMAVTAPRKSGPHLPDSRHDARTLSWTRPKSACAEPARKAIDCSLAGQRTDTEANAREVIRWPDPLKILSKVGICPLLLGEVETSQNRPNSIYHFVQWVFNFRIARKKLALIGSLLPGRMPTDWRLPPEMSEPMSLNRS